MEFNAKLSKNLRAIRGGRSQVNFAQQLGITKSTLQAIEKERSAVRLDTLEVICDNLNLPVAALLSDDLKPAHPDVLSYILNHLEWFVSLPEAEQDAVLRWLRETVELWSRLADNH